MLKNIRNMGRSTSEKKDSDKPNTAPEYSLSDPKDTNRAKAVAILADTDSLLQIATSDTSELVRDTAARRYSQVAKDIEPIRQALTALFEADNTKPLFFSITAQSYEESLRALATEKAQSDEDWMIIADKSKFHEARLHAANKLSSLTSVDQCWRKMKTKDKLVARELKARLDKQREEHSAAESRGNHVEKIIDEMDKIANGPWLPSSVNRFDAFSTQWQQLDFEPAADATARYRALQDKARIKADEWRSNQTQQDQRQNIINELERISESTNNVPVTELQDALREQKNNLAAQQKLWNELDSKNPSSDSDLKRYKALCNTTETRVKHAATVAKTQQLLDSESPTPNSLRSSLKGLESLKANSSEAEYEKAVPQLLESLNTKIDQKSKADSELRQQIHKQLGSLNSAIAAKKWAPAKSIQERLEKKINKLDSKSKASYTEKLERLKTKVTELGDWKEFASEPKLKTLCEQMEKVPSLKLAPNDCANRIKDLQTQWKAMGASPAQEQLWPRFKEASDIAYEPCGKFFTAKREDRKQKLDKRKEICQLLEQYEQKTDWTNPDWKLVEKTLRTAKNEWKNNQVFDKKKGKALEDRFTKILNLIDEKLDPVYEANVAEKKDLIEKVTKLGEGDVSQHSINQVKSLQSAWRLSGKCRAKDDRALWNEFKAATNGVFDTFRGKQREQRAASLEHVVRAREIIKVISGIKNTNEPVNEKTLTELQTEFSELPEFPERDQKKLERDLRRALDSVDNYRQQSLDNNRKRALQSLQHNAGLCLQLENLAGQNADSIKDQIETITSEWQPADRGENPQAAKAMEARKNTIVELLNSNKSPDYDANTTARRLICIELEILCDVETPADDKAMRMQYQLDQLQKGLQSSSASLSKPEQIEQLQIKWLTTAAAHPDSQDKLESRFQQALDPKQK